MNTKISRRNFIKQAVAVGIIASAPDKSLADTTNKAGLDRYKPKELPTVLFGKTGVRIPRIVLGLGSRFCHIDTDEEAVDMLNFALDHGFYYWDTADSYDNTIAIPPGKKKAARLVVSEERVGEVVKYRRKEIFLCTKLSPRNPDEVMKQLDISLKRLHTDRLDMLMIHDVHSLDDNATLLQKGGLVDILHRLKEEKVTRFIGFSGHASAEALKDMAEKGDFDALLMAMNHWGGDKEKREEGVIPCALGKNMGVLLMKAVRPRETVSNVKVPDLIRYALSIEGPHAVTIGMDSIDVVKSNIEILKDYVPMNEEEKQKMAYILTPFFLHQNLPWMQNNYIDGHWGKFSM